MLDQDVLVSVVVVSFNSAHVLPNALALLKKHNSDIALEIIVVENASSDNSLEVLAQLSIDNLIVNRENVGFGRACNQGFLQAKGAFVLLLNPDAYVREGAIRQAIQHMMRYPDCGILGAYLVDDEGIVQPSCRVFPSQWAKFRQITGLGSMRAGFAEPAVEPGAVRATLTTAWSCDWVPGCFFMIRQSLIHETGGFDPRFFVYFEEVDLCRRAIASGWQVHCAQEIVVNHTGGESAKSAGSITQSGRQSERLQIESEWLYFRKWNGLLGGLAVLAVFLATDLLKIMKHTVRGNRQARDELFNHLALVLTVLKLTKMGAEATR